MAQHNTTTPLPAEAEGISPRHGMWLSVVVAGLVGVVGAAAVGGSTDLGYWTSLGPGPGFFPMWLGILLCGLSVAWLVQVWRSTRRRGTSEGAGVGHESPGLREAAGAPDLDADDAPEYSLPTVVAILVSLCVLAAALEVVGYQLSMLVFLLFHLVVLGRRRLLFSLLLSLAGSFGVFVLFTRLLTVPLPASSLPVLRDLGL